MDGFRCFLFVIGIISCSCATTDTEDRPVVYNITCNSGFASLNVTTTESCEKDRSCRILDENGKARVTVFENDKTVSVPCNSYIYYFKVDDQVLACYRFANETTPPQGAIYGNETLNLLWLFLLILVLIGVVVLIVYLWKRLTPKPPATSSETEPMNDAAPPAAQP